MRREREMEQGISDHPVALCENMLMGKIIKRKEEVRGGEGLEELRVRNWEHNSTKENILGLLR